MDEASDTDPVVQRLHEAFTEEERAYIVLMSADAAVNDRRSAIGQLLSSLVFFVPASLIGFYGLYAMDAKIIGIGFLTLLASLLWAYLGNLRSFRYEEIGRRVVAKLAGLLDAGRQG